MQPLLFKAQMWKLLDRCDWDGVRKILSDERNNSSSSASVRGSGSMHHNLPAATKRCYLSEAHARLPLLSYALWKRAPEDVVWRIMELSPRSVTAADSRGRLPLHVACLQSASPAVVDGLLDKKPFAALQADEEGNIPLHYAIYAACCRSSCHDHSSCGSWNSDNGDAILGRGVEPKDVSGRYCRTRSSRRSNMLSAKCHYLTLDEHLDIVSSLLVVNPASALVLNNAEEAPLDMASELDEHEQRHVYTMISNVSQTFNFHVAAQQKSKRSRRSSSHHHHHHKGGHGRKARHSTSSSFTLPSSSYLMEMSASCFFQEDEEEVILFGEEQSAHYSCAEQARGEKPPRRMAYANVLEATHGLRTIRSL